MLHFKAPLKSTEETSKCFIWGSRCPWKWRPFLYCLLLSPSPRLTACCPELGILSADASSGRKGVAHCFGPALLWYGLGKWHVLRWAETEGPKYKPEDADVRQQLREDPPKEARCTKHLPDARSHSRHQRKSGEDNGIVPIVMELAVFQMQPQERFKSVVRKAQLVSGKVDQTGLSKEWSEIIRGHWVQNWQWAAWCKMECDISKAGRSEPGNGRRGEYRRPASCGAYWVVRTRWIVLRNSLGQKSKQPAKTSSLLCLPFRQTRYSWILKLCICLYFYVDIFLFIFFPLIVFLLQICSKNECQNICLAPKMCS